MVSADPSPDVDVDVIVTVRGGAQSARAITRGGGLVGLHSTASRPPASIPIEFVDWPFMEGNPSLQAHLDVVREERPRYAVAPDVAGQWDLEAVLAAAADLDRYAETTIVVPKTVHPNQVPDRYRVGLPFRDNFETDLGVNTFADFSSAGAVHVLGGNPTDHFAAADRFGLEVASVDSPVPLAWADFGRVWLARERGADDVDALTIEDVEVEGAAAMGLPTLEALLTDRSARIRFSVRNLVQAWGSRGRHVTIRRAVAPGRGPPPVPPRGGGLLGPAETFEERERMREWFLEATEETELGRVEREERHTTLDVFGDDPDDPDESEG